jgi:hypothetical protein
MTIFILVLVFITQGNEHGVGFNQKTVYKTQEECAAAAEARIHDAKRNAGIRQAKALCVPMQLGEEAQDFTPNKGAAVGENT